MSSSDQVEWSYADIVSTLTLRDAHKIATRYNMEVAFLQEVGRVHRPQTGHVMVSEVFPKFGVWIPLHQGFRNILNYYNLTVF